MFLDMTSRNLLRSRLVSGNDDLNPRLFLGEGTLDGAFVIYNHFADASNMVYKALYGSIIKYQFNVFHYIQKNIKSILGTILFDYYTFPFCF